MDYGLELCWEWTEEFGGRRGWGGLGGEEVGHVPKKSHENFATFEIFVVTNKKS